MTESLIEQSGKSRDWLTENLFSNMSSIDFDGDGEGGEYGDAFFSLEPVDSKAVQPFHFGEYKNTFRWYSYAIHGTQDEERIGKCITGGCVNVSKASVAKLLGVLKSGDTGTDSASVNSVLKVVRGQGGACPSRCLTASLYKESHFAISRQGPTSVVGFVSDCRIVSVGRWSRDQMQYAMRTEFLLSKLLQS
jgi:hypothetical protein